MLFFRREVLLSWAAAAAVLFSSTAQAAPVLVVAFDDPAAATALARAIERQGVAVAASSRKRSRASAHEVRRELEALAEAHAAKVVVITSRRGKRTQVDVTTTSFTVLRSFEVATRELSTSRRAKATAQQVLFALDQHEDEQACKEATLARIQVKSVYPGFVLPPDAPYVGE